MQLFGLCLSFTAYCLLHTTYYLLRLFRWKRELCAIPADRGGNGEETDHKKEINFAWQSEGAENIRTLDSPDKQENFQGEKQEGKDLLHDHRVNPFCKVIEPPGVEASSHCDRGEENGCPQAVERCGFKSGYARDQVQDDESGDGQSERNGKMNGHGMGMSSEHGYPGQDPFECRRQLSFRRFSPHVADRGVSLQHFRGMRRRLDVVCEIGARIVPVHVAAGLPEFALCDIIDFALVGYVARSSLFPIELLQLVHIDFFRHLHSMQ